MFKDEALISFQAGKGGNGMVCFRREKFVPKGGPSGGDGGDGGSIYIQASLSESSLYPYTAVQEYHVKPGKPGMSSRKAGKNSPDLILKVPVGTILRDPETREILCDLVTPQQKFLLARGGRGGRGNCHFATSTNQTPMYAEKGEEGESGSIFMELKLIADVGIIGLPNAGKSTLLSVLTRARPKIGAYPFTTLNPQLGFAELDSEERILFADIPGLIEGSHSGVGLGDQFLRHIERTRILLHLIDISEMNTMDPVQAYNVIRKELGQFSPALLEKKEIVVATKMDLNPDPQRLTALETKLQQKILTISSVNPSQLRILLLILYPLLQTLKKEEMLNASLLLNSSQTQPSPPHSQPQTSETASF